MEEQPINNSPQSRVKKGSNSFIIFAITVVVIVSIGFFLYLQKNTSKTAGILQNQRPNISKTLPSEQTTSPSTDSQKTIVNDQEGQSVSQQEKDSVPSQVDARANTEVTLPDDSPGHEETPVANSVPSAANDTLHNNQQFIEIVNAFYDHLDQQAYLQNLGKKELSKGYFSKLLQKLADNPPVVIRETDDLFTILQNTAHFFRILGKDNIFTLKKILATEHNSFEQPLKAFYALTSQPEDLKKEYSLTIPPKALVDYAAFFLNTMGGRLYLFRRDSTLRMIVSYYAIITIDRANIDRRGDHGIDLRPAIFSLVEEMENGGKLLQLKDEYLDTLYDLQEKYN